MSKHLTIIPEISLSEVNGEPRARDLDIAQRLGFGRDRDIRPLIERNLAELETFGVCAIVSQNHGGGRGRPAKEYWLNEEQSLLIAVKSEAENAAAVRAMLIKVFVAYRRGHLAPVVYAKGPNETREARLTFKHYLGIGKLVGLTGNQLVIAANQATLKSIGVDSIGNLGITHMAAPQNEALLTPTEFGARLGGTSAQEVNRLLVSRDAQAVHRDKKGNLYYEPTAKGIEWGAVMQDTGKRHGDGTPVRQLKWASGAVEKLRSEIMEEAH